MPRNLSDSFFGSIALKNRMLTREQLTQALRVQLERTHDGRGPTLGEVCRMLDFLRDDQVNAILWAQAKSEVLLEDSLTGSICLANKLVTQEQLDEALEDQRALDFTVRLGVLLCEKGYLDRQQLQAVLRAQVRIKTQAQKLKPVIVPPSRPSAAAGWAAARTAKAAASGASGRAKATVTSASQRLKAATQGAGAGAGASQRLKAAPPTAGASQRLKAASPAPPAASQRMKAPAGASGRVKAVEVAKKPAKASKKRKPTRR